MIDIMNILNECIVDIELNPSKKLFDVDKQKERFGSLFKEIVPISEGKFTPAYTGLFREYTDYIQTEKRLIILLGPSGTSKTYILQQEAQKRFMIYILCNDGDSSAVERDSSFTLLRLYLKEIENQGEDEKLRLISIFMIARLWYLKLALDKAKSERKELKPSDFFMMQINGHSKQTESLFGELKKNLKGRYGWIDTLKSLVGEIHEILQTYNISQKKICFAIDEASVGNQLFPQQ